MLLVYPQSTFHSLTSVIDRLQSTLRSLKKSETCFFLEKSVLHKLHKSPSNLRSRRGNGYVEIIRRLDRVLSRNSHLIRFVSRLQTQVLDGLSIQFVLLLSFLILCSSLCGVQITLTLEALHSIRRDILLASYVLAKLHRVCCRGGKELHECLSALNAGEFTSTYSLRLATVARFSVACRDILLQFDTIYSLLTSLESFVPCEAALGDSDDDPSDPSYSRSRSRSRRSILTWDPVGMQDDCRVPFSLPSTLSDYFPVGVFGDGESVKPQPLDEFLVEFNVRLRRGETEMEID